MFCCECSKVAFGNLNLDFESIDLKCLDFKSINFIYHFKFIDCKGLKFLVDLVELKYFIF